MWQHYTAEIGLFILFANRSMQFSLLPFHYLIINHTFSINIFPFVWEKNLLSFPLNALHCIKFLTETIWTSQINKKKLIAQKYLSIRKCYLLVCTVGWTIYFLSVLFSTVWPFVPANMHSTPKCNILHTKHVSNKYVSSKKKKSQYVFNVAMSK